MKENSVIFKGVPNGLIIILSEEIEFEELKEIFLKKVIQAKDFFEDANICIEFKGRILKEEEELQLLEIISNQSQLEISFVNNEQNVQANSNIQAISKPKVSISELIANNNQTYFYKGSLRSGQRIEFDGSVVVIGDVNPGAQILAAGNIIVLGKLKGSVHAGYKGADGCFVVALDMMPIQLIIKQTIIDFPKDLEKERGPEYVYIKDNQTFVEQLG